MLWKLVCNWQQSRTVDLSELGDIGLSPASRETSQTNKPPKHYTKMGGHNISSYSKKKRKHTKLVSATIRVQVYQETPHLTRPEHKGGKTWRWMTSEWHINSLPAWTACCQNNRTADQPYQPTHTPVHHPH